MRTLFKTFSKLLPYQAKSRTTDPLGSAPLIGSDFRPSDTGLTGVLFRIGSGTLIERKTVVTLFLALFIYLAASFLANEWLYLLSCALVVAVVLGLIVPALTIRSLSAHCWMPPVAVANEGAEVAISIAQGSWFKAIGWLLPIDCLRTRILLARRSIQGYVVEPSVAKQPILLENVAQRALLKLQVPEMERGVYKLSSVEVSTPFPFGMSWAVRNLRPQGEHEESTIVYPRSWSLNGTFLAELLGQASSMGLSFTETLALTQSTSVRTIREFRLGDSLRHIHWASSARLGKILVREFDSETLPVFDLYLDLCANWLNREQFELAICLITSLINFGYDHDILPELHVTPAIDSEELAGLMCDLPTGKAPLEMMLEILARVDPLPPRSIATRGTFSANRELLAIVPAADVFLRGNIANAVSTPVQLVAVKHGASREVNLADQCPIATIYGETDLQAL
jgi:hypothetical protein